MIFILGSILINKLEFGILYKHFLFKNKKKSESYSLSYFSFNITLITQENGGKYYNRSVRPPVCKKNVTIVV